MSFCPRELHPITPPMAGTLLTAIDLWLTSLYSSSHGSGNRSRQGPEVRLSPSTSHSPNTHTHMNTHDLTLLAWPWAASGERSCTFGIVRRQQETAKTSVKAKIISSAGNRNSEDYSKSTVWCIKLVFDNFGRTRQIKDRMPV